MDPEQLRRALIEQGFHEAAAMVAADVEAQALEEDEGGEVVDIAEVRSGGARRLPPDLRELDDAA